MTTKKGPSTVLDLDAWTALPCAHDGDDLGRYALDVCHGCGTVVMPKARSEEDNDV
jgi:hypothetical protein